MQATLYLRIVIMNAGPGAWCETCGLPSATTVAYVLEPTPGGVPDGLRTLTYCQACEGT